MGEAIDTLAYSNVQPAQAISEDTYGINAGGCRSLHCL